MNRQTEDGWREVLEKRGRDGVQAELDMARGNPGDLMFSLGDAPPFPTRAFCEQWCRGDGGKRMGPSVISLTIAGMVAMVFVSVVHMIGSWSDASNLDLPQRSRPSLASQPSVASNNTIQNNSVISTASQRTMLSNCTSVSDAGNLHTVQARQACRRTLAAPSGASGKTTGGQP